MLLSLIFLLFSFKSGATPDCSEQLAQTPFVDWARIHSPEKYKILYETALLDGERVFIKFDSIHDFDPRYLFNEVSVSMALNRVGVGPKFIGVTRKPSGADSNSTPAVGLIYAFVPGDMFRAVKSRGRYQIRGPRQRVTEHVLVEVERTFECLREPRIQMRDVQFLISENQATLIDFGEYRQLDEGCVPDNEAYRRLFVKHLSQLAYQD